MGKEIRDKETRDREKDMINIWEREIITKKKKGER